jgi:hypothetical protein
VVEKAYATCNRSLAGRVEIDRDLDARFIRPSLYGRNAVAIEERSDDVIPVAAFIDPEAGDAYAFGKFEICFPVANYGAASDIDRVSGKIPGKQPGAGLPAVAVVLLKVGADEYLVEAESLRGEKLDNVVLA